MLSSSSWISASGIVRRSVRACACACCSAHLRLRVESCVCTLAHTHACIHTQTLTARTRTHTGTHMNKVGTPAHATQYLRLIVSHFYTLSHPFAPPPSPTHVLLLRSPPLLLLLHLPPSPFYNLTHSRVWDLVATMARECGIEFEERRPRWERTVLKHQRLANLCNNVLVLIKK
jgi:hypothetical protein